MKNVLIGGLVAAIAMYMLGLVYWGLLPMADAAYHMPQDATALGEMLSTQLQEDGAYFVPGIDMDDPTIASLYESGPIATIHIRKAGAASMQAAVMIGGFVHMLITCMVLAFFLRMALPALGTYGKRVGFITLTGFIGTFWAGASTIWWYQSATWHTVNGIYDVMAFAVAGLILARFIQPEVGTPVEPATAGAAA